MTQKHLPQPREQEQKPKRDMRAVGEQIVRDHKEAFDRLADAERAERAKKQPSVAAE